MRLAENAMATNDDEKVMRMAEVIEMTRLSPQSMGNGSSRPLSEPLEKTLEMLDALGEAGLVVVENEPSGSMMQAGAKAGGVDAKTARDIYKAMIKV